MNQADIARLEKITRESVDRIYGFVREVMMSEAHLSAVRHILPIEYAPLRDIIIDYARPTADEVRAKLMADKDALNKQMEELNRHIERMYDGRATNISRARVVLNKVRNLARDMREQLSYLKRDPRDRRSKYARW